MSLLDNIEVEGVGAYDVTVKGETPDRLGWVVERDDGWFAITWTGQFLPAHTTANQAIKSLMEWEGGFSTHVHARKGRTREAAET